MIVFLFFSMLSGILELGIVLKPFAEGMPIWVSLLMGVMYQLGNLLFKHYSRNINIKIGFATLIICGMYWYYNNIITETIFVMLLSLCIQIVRARYKTKCPTSLKRTFRIAGFILSLFMIKYSRYIMTICTILSFIAMIQKYNDEQKVIKKQHYQKISITMIFHQIHYFMYTYIMPLTVMELTDNNALETVILYALTWIVYLIPGLIAEKNKNYNPKFVFILCHTLLACVIGTLTFAFLSKDIIIGLIAWMLTGIGGGSVFCIEQFVTNDKKRGMSLSENIGHIIGATLAFFVSLLITKNIGTILTSLSFLFVCMTLLSAIFEIKQNNGTNK